MYLFYATALVLILTFASGMAKYVISWMEGVMYKKEITDVSVKLDEGTGLMAGTYYSPEYTAIGDFEGNPGLVFTSLTEEHFTVSTTGVIYSDLDFEGEYLDAQVKITSKYDKDFEKIVSFRFLKRYPDSVSVVYYMKGHSYGSKTLYLGVPVYVSASVTSADPYNVSDYTVLYNEEYFERSEDGAFIPVKATPEDTTLNFVATFGNGSEWVSSGFNIKEPEYSVADADEMRINDVVADEYEVKKGESLVISLFKNGKRVAADYAISVADESDISKSLHGNVMFLTPGDKTLTVSLPGGFTKTVLIKVRNVISAPVFTDSELQQNRLITINNSNALGVKYSLETGVTYETVQYEYDEDVVSITAGYRSFTLTPKKNGTTTVKMIIDDGITRVEESFTVEVQKDVSLSTLISENLDVFVSKVLGHGSVFFVLAFFAMNMFKYFGIESKLVRFPLYTLTGLSVAALSEYIQTHIPTRSGRVQDVLIDMAAFYVGTLVVVALRKMLNLVRR